MADTVNPLAQGFQTLFNTMNTMGQAIMNSQAQTLQAFTQTAQQVNANMINTMNSALSSINSLMSTPMQNLQSMQQNLPKPPLPMFNPPTPPAPMTQGGSQLYPQPQTTRNAEIEAQLAAVKDEKERANLARDIAIRQELSTGQDTFEQQMLGGFTAAPVEEKVMGEKVTKTPVF